MPIPTGMNAVLKIALQRKIARKTVMESILTEIGLSIPRQLLPKQEADIGIAAFADTSRQKASRLPAAQAAQAVRAAVQAAQAAVQAVRATAQADPGIRAVQADPGIQAVRAERADPATRLLLKLPKTMQILTTTQTPETMTQTTQTIPEVRVIPAQIQLRRLNLTAAITL